MKTRAALKRGVPAAGVLLAAGLWLAAFGTTAARPGRAERRETLKEIFARKIAYTRASPFFRELHTPHLKKFIPKPWRAAAGEILVDVGWTLRTEGALESPGPFAEEELRTFFSDSGGIVLGDSRSGGEGAGTRRQEIVLRVGGAARDRREAEAYSITASPGRIGIESPSWRGVLYGVSEFENVRLSRGIPAIKPGGISRKPLYEVRMFGDVYGTFTVSGLRIDRPVSRETFSALSRFGANATFTFVQLGDYLDGRTYPELGNPDWERNIAELKRLADTAKAAGVDLYLDAYNPKLPGGHPVFAAHPNARGAGQHGGDIRCLCPSDPETLRFIAESWAEVFRRVPSLGGMVAIIGGEGFYHCYMRSGKGAPDCPRCSRRSPEDVVAGPTNAVFRAVRRVKPDAELLAWPYSAFVWSSDPFQLGLIAKLDPGIQIVPEIDKDFILRKDGYEKSIWDYSIDFIGPSDRYRAMSEAARKRGLKVCCKTETAVSLEMNGAPAIPCLQRWGERASVIRAQRPDSIIYAYDITGFSRSRPEELAGRLSWTPSGTPEEEIRSIARRDFGEGAADAAIGAWQDFSEAMGHIPYLTHGYYKGPSFIGAGQPLMVEEKELPRALFGRFFYLAENDLSEGTSEASMLRPIYAPEVKAAPAEMADMDRAVELWDRGVGRMIAARSAVASPRLREFERELDLAAYLGTVFRAVSDSNHFFALRAEYLRLTGPDAQAGDAADRSQKRAADLLSRMRAIVRSDLGNARTALAIARRDPRLDLAVRLDLDYEPLVKIIEAKIGYEETVVERQFADALGKIGNSNQKPAPSGNKQEEQ